MIEERITIDGFGLDEILLDNVDVHVERMDKGTMWMAFSRHGDPERKRIAVAFSAKGKILRAEITENEIGVEAKPKRPA